jgi:predicted ATPase
MSSTPSLRALGCAALLVAASSCSVFHRHRDAAPAVVVEPVRTPDSPTPPTAARDLADAMTTVLHLRPDQTTRARQVLNSTVEQVNAARQQYPAQSPQLNAALARINASSDKQLRQILGPTSYREMQVKRAQIQAEMQQRR